MKIVWNDSESHVADENKRQQQQVATIIKTFSLTLVTLGDSGKSTVSAL